MVATDEMPTSDAPLDVGAAATTASEREGPDELGLPVPVTPVGVGRSE